VLASGSSVEGLVIRVEERSGNRVHLLQVSQCESAEAVESGQPLIGSLRSDARTLAGEDLRLRLGGDKRR